MTWVQRLAALENKMLDRSRSSQADTVATTPPTGTMGDLGSRNYCVLVTYRKDGTPVPSPLWFGVSNGKLYFHTAGFKVKRIERNPDVLVAPGTFRGRPLGPPLAGTARVLPAPESAVAEECIAKKYGLQRRLYLKVFGQEDLGVHVEVTPTAPE
jgi:PPOX class probable F420-dependent enzyme